jgi:sugar transferase (PEP-CTERM/EpsH1 system associated)
MTPVHVAHVLHSLGVGGTENGVANVIRALGRGFRHSVVVMTESGPTAHRLPADVTVHEIRKRPGIDPGAFARLVSALRRLAPDIVHSRNWSAFDAVPAARLAGGAALVHGEHGRAITDPHGHNRRRNLARRLLSPLVSRFVTVSFDLRRWLTQVVGIPERKVLTIHNGVDTTRFADDGREAARRTLGVADDVVVVGTVGRLDPVKDQLGLLEAFAHVGPGGPRALLVVVGDGPCREALAIRAARADLAGRVRLLGERDDVPTVLRALDVFALPSIAEGISNTILEAMASGLPVVATRTGGNPELVEDGVTGTLVTVGAVADLAQGLRAYVGDPHLRALHGKAGRHRAVDEFSLDRMASRYRDLYLTLTSERSA